MKPKIEDIKFDIEELNKIKQKPNTKNQQWLMRSLIGAFVSNAKKYQPKR